MTRRRSSRRADVAPSGYRARMPVLRPRDATRAPRAASHAPPPRPLRAPPTCAQRPGCAEGCRDVQMVVVVRNVANNPHTLAHFARISRMPIARCQRHLRHIARIFANWLLQRIGNKGIFEFTTVERRRQQGPHAPAVDRLGVALSNSFRHRPSAMKKPVSASWPAWCDWCPLRKPPPSLDRSPTVTTGVFGNRRFTAATALAMTLTSSVVPKLFARSPASSRCLPTPPDAPGAPD